MSLKDTKYIKSITKHGLKEMIRRAEDEAEKEDCEVCVTAWPDSPSGPYARLDIWTK